jgi:hypothetical protein
MTDSGSSTPREHQTDPNDGIAAGTPEPGTDSRVGDWFGQSVAQDAELADSLVDEVGMEEAERRFEREATGEETQEHRRGDHIDPEQGEAAYHADADANGGSNGSQGAVAKAKAGVMAVKEAAMKRSDTRRSEPRPSDEPVADADRLLHIYLRDHHAMDTAGLALAHRTVQHNEGSEFEQELRDLAHDIEEDSKSLRMAMAELGIDPSPMKMLVARGAELVARLKSNGRIVEYSPSSRVLELEDIIAGLAAKQQFWRSLSVAEQEALPRDEVERLIERAGEQVERATALHDRAATIAFAA